MMKIYIMLLFASVVVASCKKDTRQSSELEGTWVERNFERDTLIVYQSNGKSLLFDNCDLYRSRQGIFPGNEFFTWEYRLNKDSIGLRFVNSGTTYFYYSFRWIKPNEEFTMSINGIRPYLSMIGSVTYRRIK